MAFASKKAARVIIGALLAATAWSAPIHFEARHEHLRTECAGTMTIDERGISYEGAKNHNWRWNYPDIQELKLGAHSVRVTSGRTYDFRGEVPAAAYALWKDRLDQRFVAELADPQAKPEWRIPVRHRALRRTSQGVIEICADRIIYSTDRENDSRTWRFSDIENISSSGPFDLTVVTFERARLDYGDRRQFNFQLKEAITEARYDELWRKINQYNRRIQIP